MYRYKYMYIVCAIDDNFLLLVIISLYYVTGSHKILLPEKPIQLFPKADILGPWPYNNGFLVNKHKYLLTRRPATR